MPLAHGPVKAVFSDLDGTLTLNGKLTPLFHDIISLLRDRHIPLVIVTGRSLSWAQFLLNYTEGLHTVIAEGGGVIVHGPPSLEHHFMIEQREQEQLEKFCQHLKDIHPSLPLTEDSLGRVSDRAIRLEDYLDYPRKEEFDQLLKKEGLQFSRSSVHLNFWCGDASKYRATSYLLKHHLHLKEEEILFFGDSLNDESMFQHITHSVGVSNISSVLNKMRYPPKNVLEGDTHREALGVIRYLENNLP